MKSSIPKPVLALAIIAAGTSPNFAAEAPKRITIGPSNDLTALVFTKPEKGSIVRTYWSEHTKAYRSGWSLGSTNYVIGGYRHILLIDDGKRSYNAFDKETNYPITVLIDAKPTAKLSAMVKGYNDAMRSVRTIRNTAEQGAAANP